MTSADIKKYLTTDKYIQNRTCTLRGHADPKKWKRIAKYKVGSKTDLEGSNADVDAHVGLSIGEDFPKYRGCWAREFILVDSDGAACFVLIEKDDKIVHVFDYSD